MAEEIVISGVTVKWDDAKKQVDDLTKKVKEARAEVVAASSQFDILDDKTLDAVEKLIEAGMELKKSNETLKLFAVTGAEMWEGFNTGLNGLKGGFSSLNGLLELFGEHSEVVESALEKVNTALEFKEKLEGIKNAGEAFKNFGSVLKEVAVKGFGSIKAAIIETGLGALAIGVITLIGYFKELSETVDEATLAQKKYNDIVDEAQNAYVNAQKSIGDLNGQIELVQYGVESSEQFVNNFNKSIGQVVGQANNLGDALGKLSDHDLVQAYVDAMLQREIATIAVGKAAQNAFKIAELVARQKEIQDKADEDKKSAKTTTTTYGSGGMYSSPVTITADQVKTSIQNKADADKKAVQDQIKQLEKDNKTIEGIAATARHTEIDKAKQYGLNISGVTKTNTQTVTTITKQGTNDVNENKRQAIEQQFKDQFEGLKRQEQIDLQVAVDLHKGEEEKYNIQKRYQELKIQALEQYYIAIGGETSKQASNIRKQITDIVNEGVVLDEKHIKAIFDAADAEIKKNFENFKPPAEVAPSAPESDDEKQRKSDKEKYDKQQAVINANDAQVSDDVDKKEKEFYDGNPKVSNKSTYQLQLKNLNEFYAAEFVLAKKQGDNKDKLDKFYSEAKKKLKKQEADFELGLTSNLLSQASDLFGKNTVAGKVTAIAAATINTYLAATKALATTPPPFSYIQAAITIATGIKNIQSIINTQVPGQGGAGGSVPATPSSPIVPQVQQTNTTLNQDQLNQIGNATVRAFVVESDVSSNQEKIARLNRAARLGG